LLIPLILALIFVTGLLLWGLWVSKRQNRQAPGARGQISLKSLEN